MQPLEQKALSLLKENKQPLNRRSIAERLGLRGHERKQLTRILESLVSKGRLEERKGFYRLAHPQKLLVGTFSHAERGFGFVRPDDPEQDDLFIPDDAIGSAMDGDRIECSCHFSPRQGRPFARVRRILKRAHNRIIGHYQQRRHQAEVWPLNRTIRGPILIRPVQSIRNGDLVTIEIEHYAAGQRLATGRILEHLGSATDPQSDIQTVIRQHNLPYQFSAEALEQADSFSDAVTQIDLDERTDLRPLPFVTIDGADAKDFDDAVALRKEPGRGYRLWVGIADVAHYVKPQSALDKDALERGTSVYFPGFCLPMLPEALSNGLCSLKPNLERLVMTAELLIGEQGTTLETSLYPAVIRSRARLTYTEVATFLEQPGQTTTFTPELQNQLLEMAELATILTTMRRNRGSLDLDLPEVTVVIDHNGRPIDLKKQPRTRAHRLIEEFMLATNEAVANVLTQAEQPMLYRIHEKPDSSKLQDLQQLAAHCGIGIILDGGPDLQHSLQKLLDSVIDKPEARMIRQQLLRSLQQACYSPERRGHFGLASDCYCHFTSPIRRYPDLVVHRSLKQWLCRQRNDRVPGGKKLQRLAQDCSEKERRAMQAERDLIQLRSCQVMAQRIGTSFQGIITSVAEFGFFVELDDIYVDGLVHIRTLDDYFYYDPILMTLTGERRRQVFRIGMRVEIQVRQVELWRRRIDFSLRKVLS